MRVFHGAQVAEPNLHAIVAQPGPVLHEIGGPAESGREDVLAQVQDVWREEAIQVCRVAQLDFEGVGLGNYAGAFPTRFSLTRTRHIEAHEPR